MKITTVKAYNKDLRLLKPYTIARNTITNVENVFLEITLENGMTGIGAANPDPGVVGESTVQTLQHLQSAFTEDLKGKDIRHFLKLIDTAMMPSCNISVCPYRHFMENIMKKCSRL